MASSRAQPSPRAHAASPRSRSVSSYTSSSFCASLTPDQGLPSMRPHCSTPSPIPSPQQGHLGSRCWLSLVLPSPALGTLQAVPDARQAPTRPRLPAARAPAPDPPLHPGSDSLPGSALDPQVHRGRHHLPGHGKAGLASLPVRWIRPGWVSTGRSTLAFSSLMLSRWASTGHDWGCKSRPGGPGKQRERQGKKVCVVGGRVLQ